MKSMTLITALVILLGVGSGNTQAEGAKEQASLNLEPFYQKIRKVVLRYYPKASLHRLGQKIHFEHDTRIFLIHDKLKSGKWQDPHETRGPQKNGIDGYIELYPGPYGTKNQNPQTFDKYYYKVRVLIPYSKKLDTHLYVRLKYPAGVSAKFLKEITTLANDFERNITYVMP